MWVEKSRQPVRQRKPDILLFERRKPISHTEGLLESEDMGRFTRFFAFLIALLTAKQLFDGKTGTVVLLLLTSFMP